MDGNLLFYPVNCDHDHNVLTYCPVCRIKELEAEKKIDREILLKERNKKYDLELENQRLREALELISDRLYHIIETPDRDNVKKWMEAREIAQKALEE